jgi:hypothetical protein
MDIGEAIALVDDLIYKPGWTLSAHDHSNRFEGAILVHLDYETINTNRAKAREGYPEMIKTYAEFPIIVADCPDQLTLIRRIADNLLDVEEHEMREALRVRSRDFWSPLHPHRLDGMRAWYRVQDLSTAQVARDLRFGIA